MPRQRFRAFQVVPEFYAASTSVGFTGSWTDEGLLGLCLARMRDPWEDEGIYLSYPMGWCEHVAEINHAQLTRTGFVLHLAPDSARAMQGEAEFRIEFVLTDQEFGKLAKALADIFRGRDAFHSPPPVRCDS